MRILFITGEYPAMQGGVGDYTRELSRALVATGADVHVLTAIEAGEDHLRQPAGPYEPSVYPILAGGWRVWSQGTAARQDLAAADRTHPVPGRRLRHAPGDQLSARSPAHVVQPASAS